jgi:hypothetical protein
MYLQILFSSSALLYLVMCFSFILHHSFVFFFLFFPFLLLLRTCSRGAAGLPRAHQGQTSKDCGIHAAHESHQPEGHARPAGNDVIELCHALVIYLVRSNNNLLRKIHCFVQYAVWVSLKKSSAFLKFWIFSDIPETALHVERFHI